MGENEARRKGCKQGREEKGEIRGERRTLFVFQIFCLSEGADDQKKFF